MTRKFIFTLLSLTLPVIAHAAVNPQNVSPEPPSIHSHINEEIPAQPVNHPHPAIQCSASSPLELTPKNVLAQWEGLDLTADQLGKIKGIYDRLAQETDKYYRSVNAKEKLLDELLMETPANEKKVRALVMEIAALHGELRFTQIRANMETASVLTPSQLEKFKELHQRPGTPHPPIPHH